MTEGRERVRARGQHAAGDDRDEPACRRSRAAPATTSASSARRSSSRRVSTRRPHAPSPELRNRVPARRARAAAQGWLGPDRNTVRARRPLSVVAVALAVGACKANGCGARGPVLDAGSGDASTRRDRGRRRSPTRRRARRRTRGRRARKRKRARSRLARRFVVRRRWSTSAGRFCIDRFEDIARRRRHRRASIAALSTRAGRRASHLEQVGRGTAQRRSSVGARDAHPAVARFRARRRLSSRGPCRCAAWFRRRT